MTEEEKVRKINPYSQTAILNATIVDLEKENAELKEKLKGFENGEVVFIGHYEAVKCYPILKERFAELEAQIEKMKNCRNCKNWNWKHSKCDKRLKGDCFKNSKWELAE